MVNHRNIYLDMIKPIYNWLYHDIPWCYMLFPAWYQVPWVQEPASSKGGDAGAFPEAHRRSSVGAHGGAGCFRGPKKRKGRAPPSNYLESRFVMIYNYIYISKHGS